MVSTKYFFEWIIDNRLFFWLVINVISVLLLNVVVWCIHVSYVACLCFKHKIRRSLQNQICLCFPPGTITAITKNMHLHTLVQALLVKLYFSNWNFNIYFVGNPSSNLTFSLVGLNILTRLIKSHVLLTSFFNISRVSFLAPILQTKGGNFINTKVFFC